VTRHVHPGGGVACRRNQTLVLRVMRHDEPNAETVEVDARKTVRGAGRGGRQRLPCACSMCGLSARLLDRRVGCAR
jgi:hypothetical protein